MENRKTIGISLSFLVVEKLDSIRGLIPRSRFIEESLMKTLDMKK